ncbi:hypothetical protein MSIMFB_04103 [Mycobacterium simulans]|uniref:PE domain-containing protein n=1 Tax=Mycobacterium simulans TaxID=627089 RepID=A0A7Z7NBB8_9MYCO|nr:PE family protein [Mycobacterium simulans]SOJ56627.1 hypothetical protein MSIMFB_04103 [Mycobacterium simulans]
MSSFVIATPGFLAAAVADWTGIEQAVGAANAAAGSTTRVLTAAGDEVSAAIARLFGVCVCRGQPWRL